MESGDMIRFTAETYINLGKVITDFSQCFYHASIDEDAQIKPDEYADLKKFLVRLKEHTEKLKLNISSAILKNKLNDLPQNLREFELLIDVIKEELRNSLFFCVSSDKASYYNSDKPLFGNKIEDKLPNLSEDIIESGNCYSLDRYTACVFHLMRIMERGVQELANNLGIPTIFTDNKDWQKIINSIRTQLNTKYPKHNEPDRIRYEAIIGHLETVKIAWRNPTMHPKATYTEEQAKILLDAVEIFMKDVFEIFVICFFLTILLRASLETEEFFNTESHLQL